MFQYLADAGDYFGGDGGIHKTCGSPHANLFLSMRKNFLHFFWLELLHFPLETCLILSSVMEIQEVGHLFISRLTYSRFPVSFIYLRYL